MNYMKLSTSQVISVRLCICLPQNLKLVSVIYAVGNNIQDVTHSDVVEAFLWGRDRGEAEAVKA